MKSVVKKRITFISFLLFAVLSVVGFIVFMVSNQHIYYEHTGSKVYASTELIQMKRGEKVAFSDANKYFDEVKERYGNKFQVHSQGAYHLSNDIANNNHENVASMIYIDKDGYINATKTGVYQLEYTFSVGEMLEGEKAGSKVEDKDACTFTALVCVYEGDEDKFEPLPDDPWSLSTKNESNPGNYILTKDVTWKADVIWTVSNFYGTLLNPNGYTLTWDIGTEPTVGRKLQLDALFGHNYGYIDGLKVQVVGGENAPIEIGDFHGLVERNYGVIQNCKIEGTVKMGQLRTNYDPGYFYALPKHGFSFNNEARMTVYTNNYIYAYETEGFNTTDFVERLWQSKGNKVYLDAWYYNDEIKAQRREVKTILATERDNNTCEHLVLGKATEEEKTVTLQIPQMMLSVDDQPYNEYHWRANVNTPLSVKDEWWHYVRYSRNSSTYEDVEVKYWLVNGKKVDNLNEVVVTEDLTIEPFVQYKETKFALNDEYVNGVAVGQNLYDVYNTKTVLDLSAVGAEEDTLITTTLNCLSNVFADPRSVKPTAIIIGKNIKVQTKVDSFREGMLFFLLDYLQKGGQLIVNGENPYVSFIDGKYFCDVEGTSLYYYFPEKDEKELTLHPQIVEVVNENTFFGLGELEKLHLSNVAILNQETGDDLTSLTEVNLGKELTIISGGHSSDTVYDFLSRIPTLQKVEVDEGHLKLKAVDNFVWDNYSEQKELLFAPATLTGEVKVPEGIQSLGWRCFMESNITHLIFPDSLTVFSEGAIDGMQKLEKITFGASPSIKGSGASSSEYPALRTIIFNDATESISFSRNSFSGANLEMIVLPKNANSIVITHLTKAYQISDDSPYWETVDGVLYGKTNKALIFYPRYKEGDSYTVKDGTESIGSYAFYEHTIKEVVLPESCKEVGTYAFQGSQIERVEFKADYVELIDLAFYGCEQLANVTVKDNSELKIKPNVFMGCSNLKAFPYENVIYIGSQAFYSAGIEYFEIGEKVTYLGLGVFEYSALKNVVVKTTQIYAIRDNMFRNTPLESVVLSDSITMIGASVFDGCKNLTAIDLKNVTEIGNSAFSESGLTSVQSELVERIFGTAFSGCENLTTVNFPNVLTVAAGVFMGSGVVAVSMPKAYLIETSAFSECGNLAHVNFADEVSVESCAFLNCYSLTELPFTITGVDIQSFEGCSSLKKATIEANIEERCVRVFADCTSLEEVTITGENLAIGAEFFAGCTSLKKVFITDTGMGNGTLLGSAFGTPSQKIEVYLDVPETFLWKGKVPANVTVYVPEEYAEKFVSEWLAEEGQILGFNFKETV